MDAPSKTEYRSGGIIKRMDFYFAVWFPLSSVVELWSGGGDGEAEVSW